MKTSIYQRNNMAAPAELEGDKQSEIKKPGVIYFSRLPPFMKPAKVRYIFSQYGEVGRLFLQPEGKDISLNVILCLFIAMFIFNRFILN